jgi:hypothetical protein
VLVAIRLAHDLDAVVVLREAIDERNDSGGTKEGVAPLLESIDPLRCTWWLYWLISAVVGTTSLDHQLDLQLAAIKTFGDA